MKRNKALEQHIAVFGESGSGKTVMVSSFYGAAQEAPNINRSGFHVVAENPTHGTQLSQNYLGMKNSAKRPEATSFSGTSYSFKVQLKDKPDAKAMKASPFNALRLVWHDYPGEWFEQDVSGPTEAQRRVDTFRALLGSDVALLLVDGQRLLENSGEEERYLKSLLTDYRNGLLLLKDDLLEDGKPLVKFPRIWIMALSKADLLPTLNVLDFRDLLIEKAGADIVELRDVLAGLVESSDALSVGEDFVLLSSAKFGADKIEVTKRIGLDLILPLAALLPFERHVRWAQAGRVSRKVALELMSGVEALASTLGVAGGLAAALIGRKNKLFGAMGLLVSRFGPSLNDAVRLGKVKLREADTEALAKQNNLTATLAGFRADLDNAEKEQILIRSLR